MELTNSQKIKLIRLASKNPKYRPLVQKMFKEADSFPRSHPKAARACRGLAAMLESGEKGDEDLRYYTLRTASFVLRELGFSLSAQKVSALNT